VLRRSLDFDLGTMELGPDGIWVDPGQIGDEDPCADCNCNLPLLGGDQGDASALEDVLPGTRMPPAEPQAAPQRKQDDLDLPRGDADEPQDAPRQPEAAPPPPGEQPGEIPQPLQMPPPDAAPLPLNPPEAKDAAAPRLRLSGRPPSNDPLTNVLRPETVAAKTGFPTTGFPETGFPTTGFPETGFPTTGFPAIISLGPRMQLSVDGAVGQREGMSPGETVSAVVTPNQPVLLRPANSRDPRIRRLPLPPNDEERRPAQDADREAETLNPLRQSDPTSNPLR
jgi:hypothetical protein